MLFGRQPRLPIDLAFGLPVFEKTSTSHSQYVEKLKSHLEDSYKIATENAEKVMGRNKVRFDKHVTASDLSIGDRVLVRNVKLRGKHKLADRWEPDVYVVQKKAGTLPVYTVKPETKDRPVRTLHRDLLLPCGYLSPASIPEKLKPNPIRSSTPVTPKPPTLPDPEDPDLLPLFLPDIPDLNSSPNGFTTIIDLPIPAPPVSPNTVPVDVSGQPPSGIIEDEIVETNQESGIAPTIDPEPKPDLIELNAEHDTSDSEQHEENTSSEAEQMPFPEPVIVSSDSEPAPAPDFSSPESEQPVRRPTRTRQPPDRLQYTKPGHPFLKSVQSLFQGLSAAFTSALQLEEASLMTKPKQQPVCLQPTPCTRTYMSIGGEPVTHL